MARDVDDLLGDNNNDTGLMIDETGFSKQGKMSVGTSRQWLGRLGKVDNGQVAVFGTLANDRFVSPVDVRLFLPREWTRDRKQCNKAGVPKDKRKFHTKIELARQIVEHARENGLNFGWVGADAGYGKGPGFCISLAQLSETFVVDVHSDFFVYLENPNPYIPVKKSKAGRPFNNYRTDEKAKGVGEIVSSIPQSDWKLVDLRVTTRGRLKVRAYREPVYIWDGKSAEVYCWHLIATRSVGKTSDIKISITNAPEGTSLSRSICSTWWTLYKKRGKKALKIKKRGRPKGSCRTLTPDQEKELQKAIQDKCPDQMKLPFALWTRIAVQQLIKQLWAIDMPIRTVGEYLNRWNFTPQKPLKKAYRQNPKAVKAWLNTDYPDIAKRAKKENAEIH